MMGPFQYVMLVNAGVVAIGGGFLGLLLFASGAAICRDRDRKGTRPPVDMAATPPWPHAGHYLLLAILFTAAAIYGSLVPLGYRPLGFYEAIERFRAIEYLNLDIRERADFIENLILFVPISFCWLAAMAVDRRRKAAVMFMAFGVALSGVAMSVALEFVQLWFPPRTVSLNDILAESIGTLLGVGLWLAMGPSITAWLRRYSSSAGRKAHMDWLLEAYFVGLLVASVVPFDLVLNVEELVLKYEEGKLVFMPLFSGATGFDAVLWLVGQAAVFIPVGILLATWRVPAGQPLRGIAASAALGGLVAATMELAQVFIYTRSATAADVLAGAVGALVGACLARGRRIEAAAGSEPSGVNRSEGRRWWWLVATSVYAAVLFLLLCWPLEPSWDVSELKVRCQRFFSIPFAGLYRTMSLDTLADVAKKLVYFALLGAMANLTLKRFRTACSKPATSAVIALGVSVGVGLTVELAQLVLPSHHADLTDVLVYGIGAAAGVLVATGLADR